MAEDGKSEGQWRHHRAVAISGSCSKLASRQPSGASPTACARVRPIAYPGSGLPRIIDVPTAHGPDRLLPEVPLDELPLVEPAFPRME